MQETWWLVRVVLIGLLTGSLVGCGDSGQKVDRDQTSWEELPRISEDAIIERMSAHMVPDPQDTSEIQHNELIDYIIDGSWDMHLDQSGIFYHILDSGTLPPAKWGDKVTVHYSGYHLDGACFDSSLKRKKPFTFFVGNTISGWNTALTMLGVGGRGIFLIPAYLAYGQGGFGNLVGPDQHLKFEIELLEIIHEPG